MVLCSTPLWFWNVVLKPTKIRGRESHSGHGELHGSTHPGSSSSGPAYTILLGNELEGKSNAALVSSKCRVTRASCSSGLVRGGSPNPRRVRLNAAVPRQI